MRYSNKIVPHVHFGWPSKHHNQSVRTLLNKRNDFLQANKTKIILLVFSIALNLIFTSATGFISYKLLTCFKCDPIKYSNGTHCLFRQNESASCDESKHCLGDMTCTNGKCQCSNTNTHHFDSSSMTCAHKTLETTHCLNTRTCRNDLGLSCVTNMCLCNVTTHFWNGMSCVVLRLFNESCSQTTQCNLKQGLVCFKNVCVCNTTSSFYNQISQTCVPKKALNEGCASDIECQEFNYLYCRQSKCVKCPHTWTNETGYCYFYNNSTVTWSLANSWCESFGGTLVCFLNGAEHTYFQTRFNNRIFWFGLSKNGSNWLWYINKTTFIFPSNWWMPSSGPNTSDDCARIDNGFSMKGSQCSSINEFLCQIR